MPSHQLLADLKLFAACFLDGELQGGPLEGLLIDDAVDSYINFLSTQDISASKFEKIKRHFSFLSQTTKCLRDESVNLPEVAKGICDYLTINREVLLPGGWTGRPFGHAIIYRMFYEQNNNLIFLAYNTGCGITAHKQTVKTTDFVALEAENFVETYSPVYAICFSDQEKLKRFGGLQTWLRKLLELKARPLTDLSYTDNTETGLYKKILPMCAYLGGHEIDPEQHVPRHITGQLDGVCVKAALDNVLWELFSGAEEYEKFVFDYKIYLLNEFLDKNKIPGYFKSKFALAIENTAQMLSPGTSLETHFSVDEKLLKLDELELIKAKTLNYFKTLPAPAIETKPALDFKYPAIEFKPFVWQPESIDNTAKKSEVQHQIELCLFNQDMPLFQALNQVRQASKNPDKRFFIHGVERLCFVYCDKFSSFKSEPFDLETSTADEWLQCVNMLYKIMFDYFYEHNRTYNRDSFKRMFREKFDDTHNAPKLTSKSDKYTQLSSPHNQLVGLALMFLSHYSSIMYYANTLKLTQWSDVLTPLDLYLAFVPSWLINGKFKRDFFLSSIDAEVSGLHAILRGIYQDYPSKLPRNFDTVHSKMLVFYQNITQLDAFSEEKNYLEKYFDDNKEEIYKENSSSLETNGEKELHRRQLIALFTYTSTYGHKTKQFEQLCKLHKIIDFSLMQCTLGIADATAELRQDPHIVISAHYSLQLVTAITNQRSGFVIGEIIKEPKNSGWGRDNWQVSRRNFATALKNKAAGTQNSGHANNVIDHVLMPEALGNIKNSNQIQLESINEEFKVLKHLRCAPPLQVLQLLDYYSSNYELLIKDDHQLFLLFSIFQPIVLHDAILLGGDLLSATNLLYKKAIGTGELGESATTLYPRGLFTLKLLSYIYTFIVTNQYSNEPLKRSAHVAYLQLDEEIQQLLAQEQSAVMQNELHRLNYYNLVKQFSASELSKPENRQYLSRVIYSRLYFEKHSSERLVGAITLAEDEGFNALGFKLIEISRLAICDVMPQVLAQLLPSHAPFVANTKASDTVIEVSFLDKHQQAITINLVDGKIASDEKSYVYLPPTLVNKNEDFIKIFGIDANPLALQINRDEYQFYWQSEEYNLSTHGLFKNISGEWYQCNSTFLPDYIDSQKYFSWLNPTLKHAFVMAYSAPSELAYEYKEQTLRSLTPAGKVCDSGDIPTHILSLLMRFEKHQYIEIIDLETPDQTYSIRLSRYGLQGYYSPKQGLRLQVEGSEYIVTNYQSPLSTGLILADNPSCLVHDCLLLVPIHLFFTNQQIVNDRYKLEALHLPELKLSKSYARFRMSNIGELVPVDNASGDQLFLVYLYCGNYQFSKALHVLQNYVPQSLAEEALYLYFIVKGLPFIGPTQEGTVAPIANSMLTVIQLKALSLFLRVYKQVDLAILEQELAAFITKLPVQIINKYARYHYSKQRLSIENRLNSYDIEFLAEQAHSLMEEKKVKARKIVIEAIRTLKTLKYQPEKESRLVDDINWNSALFERLERLQTQGPLAFARAKSTRLGIYKPKKSAFSITYTSGYDTIEVSLPLVEDLPKEINQTHHTTLVENFPTEIAPNVIYVRSDDGDIIYSLLNTKGLLKSEYISYDDLYEDEPIVLTENNLKRYKSKIMAHALEEGHILAGKNTIAGLQDLLSDETDFATELEDIFLNLSIQTTGNDLLNWSRPLLCLVINAEEKNDEKRNVLKEFCLATITSQNHLISSGVIQTTRGSEDDRNKLKVVIALYLCLDNLELFRDVFSTMTRKLSRQISLLSMWDILINKRHGLYSKLDSEYKAIVQCQSSVKDKISAEIESPVLKEQGFFRQEKTDGKQLKLYETPAKLSTLVELLQQRFLLHEQAKSRVIKQYVFSQPEAKHTAFQKTDAQLDCMEYEYEQSITEIINTGLNLSAQVKSIQSTLMYLSEEIMDGRTLLHRYVAMLPMDIQAIVLAKTNRFSAKHLPISFDKLLLEYASGTTQAYLEARDISKGSLIIAKKTLSQLIRNLILYKQYTNILDSLSSLKVAENAFKYRELQLKLASQVILLNPVSDNPALSLFQYMTQKTVYAGQWHMVEKFLKKEAGTFQNVAGQMMMGGGKTKVILVLLVYLKADGTNLVVTEVPPELLHTTYLDLKKSAKETFNQEVEKFEFNRHSPSDTQDLTRYLIFFQDMIKQKKCLVMAPTSLQSLKLKWYELLFEAKELPKGSDKYNDLCQSIDVLKDILLLFKKRADVIVDEMHIILDILFELNYALGKKERLDPEIISATLELFKILGEKIQVPSEHILASLNDLTINDIIKNPELLNHPSNIVGELIDYYSSKISMDEYLRHYLQPDLIKKLLVVQFKVFLPITLKRKLNEGYGRAKDQNCLIAVPYSNNETPTNNFFGNYIEALNYTIQMVSAEGVSFTVFKDLITSWRKSDAAFNSKQGLSTAQIIYQECRSALLEPSMLPDNLLSINLLNEGAFEGIYQCLKHNKVFIHYALHDIILPSIEIFPNKLTCNAINHVQQVRSMQGLSGTLAMHPSFNKLIQFDASTAFGIKNKLKQLLLAKNTQIVVHGQESLVGIHAVIDLGAHKLGIKNIDVAKEIAHQVTDGLIKYVLFFKENILCAWKVGGTKQDVIELRSTVPEVIESSLNVKPQQRITYYDQNHTTGIDILQAPSARAIVSIDSNTTINDFFQAIMRMRQLGAEQQIQIVLSSEMQKKLGDELTLDVLYDCLEQNEKDKLAFVVFKAACKELSNIIQVDLDERLLAQLTPQESVTLFEQFESVLIDTTSDSLASQVELRRTEIILNELKDKAITQWKNVTGNPEVTTSILDECDKIIAHALKYCNEVQQSSLNLGTEVHVEEQQEINIELRTELKVPRNTTNYHSKEIDYDWPEQFTLKKGGELSGDSANRGLLSELWQREPKDINWSKNLWLSTQYYIQHQEQAAGVLPNDVPTKPILSVFFWTIDDDINALCISQEEAWGLAGRLYRQDNFGLENAQCWIETPKGIGLAGSKVPGIEQNQQYKALKEQMYLLDADVPLLYELQDYAWFTTQHLEALEVQMDIQNKTEHANLLNDFERKIKANSIDSEMPLVRASLRV